MTNHNEPPIGYTERLKKASGTVDSFLRTGDGDEVVVPLDIAIGIMGDASDRKTEGVGVPGIEAVIAETSPAQPCEVSVVEDKIEDAVRAHIFGNMPQEMPDKLAALIADKTLKSIRPYLRTTKPVSVEVCARAACKYEHIDADDEVFFGGMMNWENRKRYIEAVLDAAGVSYVD